MSSYTVQCKNTLCKVVLPMVSCMMALFFCSKEHQSITGNETVNERTVVILTKDLEPAADAVVKIIPANQYIDIGLNKKAASLSEYTELKTDENGEFMVPELTDSVYNIIIEKDSDKAYQHNVFISANDHSISDDTLQPTGSYSAYVSLQPKDMDKIRSVYVQVLGTDVEFSNVDDEGKFTFKNLAQGTYRLRLETNVEGYTTTFEEMRIISGTDTIAADTIAIIYNGIHSVRNIRSSYDTAAGVITLLWDATRYSDLLDYVIYRDYANATTYSSMIYRNCFDTVFHDTIYNIDDTSGGRFSRDDTFSYTFNYRVAVRNNSTEIGNAYGVVPVTAFPPNMIATSIEFTLTDGSSYHFTLGDSITIETEIENSNRTLEMFSWAVGTLKNIVETVTLDTAQMKVTASLYYAWDSVGIYPIYVIVKDDAGTLWQDSIMIEITPWVIDAGRDTTISINDSLTLQPNIERKEKVDKIEWNIANSGWIESGSGDTVIIVSAEPVYSYLCSLRVTYYNGLSLTDNRSIRVVSSTPVVVASPEQVVGIGTMVPLSATITGYAPISKYEWKIGENDWIETSGPDTDIVVSSKPDENFTCIIRVTDNDGKTASFSITYHIRMFVEQEPVGDKGPTSIYAFDIDSDGDVDILSAHHDYNHGGSQPKMLWYENTGEQDFNDKVLTLKKSTEFLISVFVGDIDDDGDADLLSATGMEDKISWYENNGTECFTEHILTTQADNVAHVNMCDVDKDGDMDILSASIYDNKIAWYENDGSQLFTERIVSTQAKGAKYVTSYDVDSDGDVDILSASYNDDKIAWYENDGTQNFTEHVVSTHADGAFSVFAYDFDNDGDVDIVSASKNDNKIAWYENDGHHEFTEQVFSSSAKGLLSIYLGDFDNNGAIDILSASSDDRTIAWYDNSGTKQIIADNIQDIRIVSACDLDGDGDLDILLGTVQGVTWFENKIIE